MDVAAGGVEGAGDSRVEAGALHRPSPQILRMDPELGLPNYFPCEPHLFTTPMLEGHMLVTVRVTVGYV